MTDLPLDPPDPPPECPNCDAPLDALTHCCTECDYQSPEPDYDLIEEQWLDDYYDRHERH